VFASFLDELLESVSEIFVKNTTYLNFVFLENELRPDSKVNPGKEEPFVTFQLWKVRKIQGITGFLPPQEWRK
jgi:hypothetical protein